MNLSAEIPLKEQEIILSYLVDIPPLKYLKDCDMEDRKEHWKDCKIFYSCLQDFLKNHFAGTPLPTKEIYIEVEDSKITMSLSDEAYFQLIGLFLDYYLKLYSVLSWGWRHIDPILKAIKAETQDTSIPGTPGEALIEVIDQFFHGLFYTYFPEKVTGNYYDEYSPRKAYNLKRESSKISHLKSKKVEKLTHREKLKIAAHERKMKKEQELLEPFLNLEKFYLSICITNQKGDAALQRRLKDLSEIAEQKQAHITRNQHPRNNRQGYAINKGVVIPGSKKGGIYRTP